MNSSFPNFEQIMENLEITGRTLAFIHIVDNFPPAQNPPFGAVDLDALKQEAKASVNCFNEILLILGGIPVRLSAMDGPPSVGRITGSQSFNNGYWDFTFKESSTNNQTIVRGTIDELRERHHASLSTFD